MYLLVCPHMCLALDAYGVTCHDYGAGSHFLVLLAELIYLCALLIRTSQPDHPFMSGWSRYTVCVIYMICFMLSFPPSIVKLCKVQVPRR